MRAFIVRPFGTKQGIDFEAVERDLIRSALEALSIRGGTTGEIAQAGNIRQDMFELLLTADLVIADLSIHNANVFYELGVRHALRAERTFLLFGGGDEIPFDLKTDRYLRYDPTKPGECLEALKKGLRATLDSSDADSPVFKLLGPGLIPQDLSRFLVPPDDFREEVHRAAAAPRPGDLSLLSEEAGRLPWDVEGRRMVGNAQFQIKSFEPASVTWEAVRARKPHDVEANARLATIYQKLDRLNESDQAVQRVLADPAIRGSERAELQALLASNVKRRWIRGWADEKDGAARAAKALRSPGLERAYGIYSDGFAEDRNHFYSGLNALSLLTILVALAERFPEIWKSQKNSDVEAEAARAAQAKELQELPAAVKYGVRTARKRLEFAGKEDRWLDITEADLAFLTESSADRVRDRYSRALTEAQPFHRETARQQLLLFKALDVRTELAASALEIIDSLDGATQSPSQPQRVLVFTGHRVDAPNRKAPRFPAEAEGEARRMIVEAVEGEVQTGKDAEWIGLAGGASGGDILFHEVCRERGIRTELFVVGSRDAYVTASVQEAGPQWVRRFNDLWKLLSTRVLGDSQGAIELPRWLREAPDYNVWERSNRWILHHALVHGAENVSLLALWNGEEGDGPGGTKDMVETATKRGANTVIIDAAPLAGMAGK